MSVSPVTAEAGVRWPFSRIRVRLTPSERRFSALMPARPFDSEPDEVLGVEEPMKLGSLLTKSARLAGAWASICSEPTTVTGVGAL